MREMVLIMQQQNSHLSQDVTHRMGSDSVTNVRFQDMERLQAEAVCVLAKREIVDGLVMVSAFPGLTAQQKMTVVELLTGMWVLNATVGALELQGIDFPVVHGGAAVLLIQPQGN